MSKAQVDKGGRLAQDAPSFGQLPSTRPLWHGTLTDSLKVQKEKRIHFF